MTGPSPAARHGEDRCTVAFTTAWGDRRCDLRAGHEGLHVRNDGCGRPEYVWSSPTPAARWDDEPDAPASSAARDGDNDDPTEPAPLAEQVRDLIAENRRLTAERDEARAANAAVRLLHASDGAGTPFCTECGHTWPCLTRRALDGGA